MLMRETVHIQDTETGFSGGTGAYVTILTLVTSVDIGGF